MKQFERVEILKKRGQWKTGDRVTGLRKTKRKPYAGRRGPIPKVSGRGRNRFPARQRTNHHRRRRHGQRRSQPRNWA